ncbi:adenosylmethionine decarboxylase [Rubrivirga sp.]|uniref:adenosylmethionine decarboxylase n=1 Tax=Rubrivirga sp. TaxID=1885344 RepID=UPI003C70B9BD
MAVNEVPVQGRLRRPSGSGFDSRHPQSASPSRAGGHHLLADFWVEDAGPLRWTATWERLLPDACRSAGATVLGSRFHQFEPDGVTGIVLLAESHASVHTWPEAGLVTLDVFTCGALDTEAIVHSVRQALRPSRERVTAVARGNAAQPDLEVARTPRSSSRTAQAEPMSGPPPTTNSHPRAGGDPYGLPADSSRDSSSRAITSARAAETPEPPSRPLAPLHGSPHSRR